jgi:ankyrin repeat protein
MDTGISALITAAGSGHTETVGSLIRAGASLDLQTSDNGATALFMAAFLGHSEIVDNLIRAGASLDLQTSNGYSALIAAAYGGHTKVVDILIRGGASLDLRSNDGTSPLLLAIRRSNFVVAELLIASGASVRGPGCEELLYEAYKFDLTNIMSPLIQAGADVDFKVADRDFKTVLMLSSMESDYATVELLLREGADVNIRCGSGRTALYYATATNITQLLLEYGASYSDVNNESYRALMAEKQKDRSSAESSFAEAEAERLQWVERGEEANTNAFEAIRDKREMIPELWDIVMSYTKIHGYGAFRRRCHT